MTPLTAPQTFGLSLGLVMFYMACVWVASLRPKDTSIVDVAWGPGFVVAMIPAFVFGPGPTERSLLVFALAAIWAGRLALHIGLRKRGHGEDPRYAAWRAEHGDAWPLRSLVTVFMFQAVLCWAISSPLQWVAYRGGGALGWIDAAAAAIWAVGFTFEAVSDAQLSRFVADGKPGGLMTSGLWRYSRHPNYFGEAVLWWGLWAFTPGVPGGGWTIVAPVLITVLVRYVSGVPLLERRFAGRPGWDEYRARTSVFVPMPPRRV